jgi:single-strand DNA-binding protein|tara:strand:+ start:998 stop:1456 length:459 start_codon:yes stop_codon:yes gene_type:complete
MAGSLNKVMLIGNVGADPIIRQTQDGKKIATLSLATTDSWKDKATGEKRDKTEWHRIVIFNEGLSGVVENYVKKGQQLFIEGQLQTQKYTDANGVDKYTTQVILQNYNGTLTMIGGRSNSTDQVAPSQDSSALNSDPFPGGDDVDIDDEIPF